MHGQNLVAQAALRIAPPPNYHRAVRLMFLSTYYVHVLLHV